MTFLKLCTVFNVNSIVQWMESKVHEDSNIESFTAQLSLM